MPGNNTPEQTLASNLTSAVHQPFSWLGDDVKDHPLADFLALTMDIGRGMQTCLEIVHLSDLVRSENAELEPEQAELPAVNGYDAGNLLRFTIAAARLLHESAARQIDSVNMRGVERIQAVKGRVK